MAAGILLSPFSVVEKAQGQSAQGGASAGHVTISAGDLTVTFADNSAFGKHHRAGYNGIAELRHKSQDENVFVPFYAGFNLEHIFGGDRLERLPEGANYAHLPRAMLSPALSFSGETAATPLELSSLHENQGPAMPEPFT